MSTLRSGESVSVIQFFDYRFVSLRVSHVPRGGAPVMVKYQPLEPVTMSIRLPTLSDLMG